MDMPVNLQQAFANIDIARIQQAVEDYGPAIEVVRGTWIMRRCRKSRMASSSFQMT